MENTQGREHPSSAQQCMDPLIVAGNQGLVCRQCGVRLVLRAAETWRWVTGQEGGQSGGEGELWRIIDGEGHRPGYRGHRWGKGMDQTPVRGCWARPNAWRRVSCGGPQAGEYVAWEDRGFDDRG